MPHPTTLMPSSVNKVSAIHNLPFRQVVASTPTMAAVDTQTNVTPVISIRKAHQLPINPSHRTLLEAGLGTSGSSGSESETPSPSRTAAATGITTIGSIEMVHMSNSKSRLHIPLRAHLDSGNSMNTSNGP